MEDVPRPLPITPLAASPRTASPSSSLLPTADATAANAETSSSFSTTTPSVTITEAKPTDEMSLLSSADLEPEPVMAVPDTSDSSSPVKFHSSTSLTSSSFPVASSSIDVETASSCSSPSSPPSSSSSHSPSESELAHQRHIEQMMKEKNENFTNRPATQEELLRLTTRIAKPLHVRVFDSLSHAYRVVTRKLRQCVGGLCGRCAKNKHQSSHEGYTASLPLDGTNVSPVDGEGDDMNLAAPSEGWVADGEIRDDREEGGKQYDII